MTIPKSIERHRTAILAGEVTKTNVIGIRKALNAVERRYLRIQSDVDLDGAVMGLHDLLVEHRPRVIGELHDSGIAVLRNPRYAKRWEEWQAKAIASIDHFRLVGYDLRENYYYPLYAVWAKVPPCAGPDPFPPGVTYEAFQFINVPWQSGGNGPEILP